jgi:hypothetical protein
MKAEQIGFEGRQEIRRLLRSVLQDPQAEHLQDLANYVFEQGYILGFADAVNGKTINSNASFRRFLSQMGVTISEDADKTPVGKRSVLPEKGSK